MQTRYAAVFVLSRLRTTAEMISAAVHNLSEISWLHFLRFDLHKFIKHNHNTPYCSFNTKGAVKLASSGGRSS